MRTTKVVFGLLVLAVAACTPVATSGGPTTRVPGDGRPTRLPRPGTQVAPASGTMKYVCRGQTPTGWIAVNYIEDNEVCATGATVTYRYNTAVIVPLGSVPVGSSLEVCTAERIPANFAEVRLIPGDSRCPQEKPNADPGFATVREIRRQQ